MAEIEAQKKVFDQKVVPSSGAKAPPSVTVFQLKWTIAAQQSGNVFGIGAKGSEISNLGLVVLGLGATGASLANPKALREVMGSEFGPNLEKEVRSLQSKLGVKSDGIVGPETLKAIQETLTSRLSSEQQVSAVKVAAVVPQVTKKPPKIAQSIEPTVERSSPSESKSGGFLNSLLNLGTEKLNIKIPTATTVQIDPNVGHVRSVDAAVISRRGVADLTRLNTKYFAAIDRNSDDKVTKAELNIASRDPRVAGEKAQYVAALLANYDKLLAVEPGAKELTAGNLRALSANADRYMNRQVKWSEFSQEEKVAISGIHQSLLASTTTLTNRSDALYKAGESSISSKYLQQGVIGNCYFVSSLGAVADKNPKAIQSMIKPQGNGMYLVKFPGAPDKPQLVTAPTDTELSLYGNTGKSGLWAAVLQKAYGQYLQNNSTQSKHSFGDYRNSYGASDKGGFAGDTLQLLTGRKSESVVIKDEQSNLSRMFGSNLETHLKQANNQGSYLTASSKFGENRMGSVPAQMTGIVAGHVYQVCGYDEQTKTVKLFNPWGVGEWTSRPDKQPLDGKNDGYFSMPLAEFAKKFEVIYLNSSM